MLTNWGQKLFCLSIDIYFFAFELIYVKLINKNAYET